MAEDKTRSIEFGRFARESARKRGKSSPFWVLPTIVARPGGDTSSSNAVPKKLGVSLREVGQESALRMRKGECCEWPGPCNWGTISNGQLGNYYVYRTTQILYKWLNRKSQRRAYTWESFSQASRLGKVAETGIRKDLDPCRRAEAY